MRLLKIAGLPILILWMAWISWQIRSIEYQSSAACGLALTALEMEGKHVEGGISSLTKIAAPQRCPTFLLYSPNPMPPRTQP